MLGHSINNLEQLMAKIGATSVDDVLRYVRQAARPGHAGVGVVARPGAGGGGAHLQGERVGGSVGAAHDELVCGCIRAATGGDGGASALARRRKASGCGFTTVEEKRVQHSLERI